MEPLVMASSIRNITEMFTFHMILGVNLEEFVESLYVDQTLEYDNNQVFLQEASIEIKSMDGLLFFHNKILSIESQDCRDLVDVELERVTSLFSLITTRDCIDPEKVKNLPWLAMPAMFKLLRINARGQLTIGRLNTRDFIEPQVNSLSGWIFQRNLRQTEEDGQEKFEKLNFTHVTGSMFHSRDCEMGPHDSYMTRILHLTADDNDENNQQGWELKETMYLDADCSKPDYSIILQERFAEAITLQSKELNEKCGPNWTWNKGQVEDISITNGCRFMSIETPGEIDQLLVFNKNLIWLLSYPENTMNLPENPLVKCSTDVDGSSTLKSLTSRQVFLSVGNDFLKLEFNRVGFILSLIVICAIIL